MQKWNERFWKVWRGALTALGANWGKQPLWLQRQQRAAARSSGILNGVGAGKHAPAGLLRDSAAWMTPLTYTHTPTFSLYLSSFQLYQPDSRLRRFKLKCFRRAINAQKLTWNYPQWESDSAHPKCSNSCKSPWQEFWRSGSNTTVLAGDTHTVNVFYYSLPSSCCQDDDGDADDGSVTGFSQSRK